MSPDILNNIALGTSIILATFLWHALTLDRLMRTIHHLLPRAGHSHQFRHFWRIAILFMMSVGIICIHSVEIWMWAVLYLEMDIAAVHNLETSLYFSIVSMSTVGYGDVVLDPAWRVLGAMQAASGMILFGWSTAFMFEVLAATYTRLNLRGTSHRD